MTTTQDRPAAVSARGPVPEPLVDSQSTGSGGWALRRRSVIAGAAWFQNGTPEQRRRLVDATQEAARTAARNRTAVLAHPDLAAQLVRRLGYQRPDQWSGYVPPRWYECGGNFGEKWVSNDSPVRDVLIDLVAEAEARRSR